MRSFLVVLSLIFVLAVSSAAPVIYSTSPRRIPGVTHYTSVVVSTIDSNGTVTDLGPVIPKIGKKIYQNALRSSGLCPRGLVYNLAVDFPASDYSSVYFFSVKQGKTLWEVKVPHVWAANNASLTAMYFDANTLFTLYGNTLLYMHPESGQILKILEVWPSSMNCVPSRRLQYDLRNKILLAHCVVVAQPTTCHYLTTIDPAAGTVNVPPCLGTTKNDLLFYASYYQNNSVVIERTKDGPLVRLANQNIGSWGDVMLTSGRFSPDAASWTRDDLTAWDVSQGNIWFLGSGDLGKTIVQANIPGKKEMPPAILTHHHDFEHWEVVLPFTK
eukprot:TRINITY_DN8987_c0_g1_i1.p1 TRINITY_DN8987_c0_g1~~TRINITY_DN8987_c0_g1_i1.p1  ORF type:complete len:329 (+),score=50.40 TRINITY_DN8987_c0_g1_i1:286-1272(+)